MQVNLGGAERYCETVCETMEGHKQLKKVTDVFGHLIELHRHREPDMARAFTLQPYNSDTEALRNKGTWDLSWSVLGIRSPDDAVESLMAPTERGGYGSFATRKEATEGGCRQGARILSHKFFTGELNTNLMPATSPAVPDGYRMVQMIFAPSLAILFHGYWLLCQGRQSQSLFLRGRWLRSHDPLQNESRTVHFFTTMAQGSI